MSHFSVLVFGERVEEQLAPFQENNMGDCPVEYMEFFDQHEDALSEYEKRSLEYKDHSIEDFTKLWSGHRLNPETKRFGYWENPKAKWDWWVLGGRYANRLIKKDGSVGNSAKIKEIDLETMLLKHRKEAAESWNLAQGADKAMSYLRYGVDPDDDFETHMARVTALPTFAVLKDGTWYERGEMGWWGSVSNEKDRGAWNREVDELIKNSSPETLITCVDCHI